MQRETNGVYSTFTPCSSACHSFDTLVLSGGWGQSKASFSRNMTIPAFHSSAWRWYTRWFPVRHIHFLKNTYYLSKMFAPLLFNQSGIIGEVWTGVMSINAYRVSFTHLKNMTDKGGVYPDPTLWEWLCNVCMPERTIQVTLFRYFGIGFPRIQVWGKEVHIGRWVDYAERNIRALPRLHHIWPFFKAVCKPLILTQV